MRTDFYVYLHVKKTNGCPFYVGKGSGNRAYISSGRGLYWRKIVKKYGYCTLILSDNLTEDESFIIEKYYIKKYGRLDLNEGPLINFTNGGGGITGYKHTLETKKKISHLSTLRDPVSEYTRLKLSKIHKGRKIPDYIKERMKEANHKRFKDDPTLYRRILIRRYLNRIRKGIEDLKKKLQNIN